MYWNKCAPIPFITAPTINRNMRCIETQYVSKRKNIWGGLIETWDVLKLICSIGATPVTMINRNMRCIETLVWHCINAAFHRLIETWDVLKLGLDADMPRSIAWINRNMRCIETVNQFLSASQNILD